MLGLPIPSLHADNYDGTNAAPEGGFQTVTDALARAAEKNGAKILLSSPVSSISLVPTTAGSSSSSTPLTEVTTASGDKYTARSTVVTIPLGVLKTLPESFFSPKLNARKRAAIAGTHVGTLGKLAL